MSDIRKQDNILCDFEVECINALSDAEELIVIATHHSDKKVQKLSLGRDPFKRH